MVLRQIKTQIKRWFPAPIAHAHCDGPCGVYDPATARIYTEAVVSMTRKILDLQPPADQNPQAMATYLNTMSRYIQIKEEQAQKAKEEILILWTDYFKPQHLEQYPNLHDMFWKAAKLCSSSGVWQNCLIGHQRPHRSKFRPLTIVFAQRCSHSKKHHPSRPGSKTVPLTLEHPVI
ncbi:superoxide dismutase, Ni [Acaryochloris sp. CCMEE 5410]|uniref:superoxide dismutase, Ni n=1 Tax=Acaryochloris sp. CCMEE 5410 TaxID=310037 RepID=UPI0021CE1C4B|nr:superoxide dismutase, Ni [Acaryochloris sp. CCMEE 5410]